MPELVPKLKDGFGLANTLRIYRGEPARVQDYPPNSFLQDSEMEAARCKADGLSQEEIAEEMNLAQSTVASYLSTAHRRLGITAQHQFAGFFPLDPEDDIVQDKTLEDLTEKPRELRVLEALSVGKLYTTIGSEEKIAHRTVVRSANYAKNIWPDTQGLINSIRVANAIRARYVEAIEAQPEVAGGIRVRTLTFPVLAELEPRILGEIMPGAEVADLTHAA